MHPLTDRRGEPRIRIAVRVRISGRNAQHETFTERALAVNLSRDGALLWGIATELRSGDFITLQYGKRAARFRIVWVLEEAEFSGTQVAIQLLHNQACPWEEALPVQQAAEQLC